MYERARRWADADRRLRFERIQRLEMALQSAMMMLSVREQTAASKESMAGWQRLLNEQPAWTPSSQEQAEPALL